MLRWQGLALVPDNALLRLTALWLVLGVGAIFIAPLLPWWQGCGVLAAAFALADAVALRGQRGNITVEREVARALPVGTRQTVQLRLSRANGKRGRLTGWLYDMHPPAFQAEGLPLAFELPEGRWTRISYGLQISERGLHRFSGVELRIRSPFGLWLAVDRLEADYPVRVYPDFARVVHYTLLATDNRLSQLGVLQRRRRGAGQEFHQLRDYRREDALRQIDWKASVRARHMISREYQDERDQQIVFLLDCGARMRTRDDTLSHFDHTLNALLLLAYVALRQGDAVGLCTFGHDSPRYLPPKKSVAMVNTLLNAMYDLEPTLQTPDFLSAGEFLAGRLRKRALLVLVTNLREEDGEGLQAALRQLRQRHSITVASLRESVLDSLGREPVADFDAALTRAAALEYIATRRRMAATLRHNGVQLLDVNPARLPVALVNHYWERKRAGAF